MKPSVKLTIVVGALVLVATLAGFTVGFIQLGQSVNPNFVGLLFGIGSALAWGWASLGLNNILNTTAALFAVISLGYLSSANTICTSGYDQNEQQFLGPIGTFGVEGLCYLRKSYWRQ
jgi:hypothetical protein